MARGDLALVLMAAGKGTRMRSRLPKVLHPVCGRPILMHALELGRELGATRRIVIVGSGEAEVREALAGQDVELVRQTEQLGTAHAALATRAALADHDGPVIVMNGDHPLYRPATLAALRDTWQEKKAGLAILVTELPDPHGYGRVLRDASGRVARVVEEKDCSDAERRVREVNLGAYCADRRALFELLARVGNDNAKREYYITDLVELALSSGHSVESSTAADWRESLGINTRAELAQAESLLRERIAAQLMADGVTLTHPETTFVDVDVRIGEDTVLAAGVTIRAGSRIGSGCRIEPGVVIEGATIGDDSHIKPGCFFERGVRVGSRCEVGPNAHLRPGADLRDDVRVGNYVEIKNSVLGNGTKADHLSYIGDADVGEGVTIGCGAITVNYDGAKKTRTTIGDRAFIGCNSNLIAPVTIEPEAYVAAGSTITKSVPGGALAVARGQQRVIEGWRKKRFGDGSHE